MYVCFVKIVNAPSTQLLLHFASPSKDLALQPFFHRSPIDTGRRVKALKVLNARSREERLELANAADLLRAEQPRPVQLARLLEGQRRDRILAVSTSLNLGAHPVTHLLAVPVVPQNLCDGIHNRVRREVFGRVHRVCRVRYENPLVPARQRNATQSSDRMYAHLEVLRLDSKKQVEELARGQSKLKRLRVVGWHLLHDTLEHTQQLGEDDRPEVGEVLRADPAHDDTQTQVDLCSIAAPLTSAVKLRTYLAVHPWRDHICPQNIDELLLNSRQLCQVVILLGCKEHEREPAEVGRSGDHLLLSIGKDISGWRGGDPA